MPRIRSNRGSLRGRFRDDGVIFMAMGAPISMFIRNVDQRFQDYNPIIDQCGLGYVDYIYDVKYGIRDYCSGGHASRETAVCIAAGVLACKIVPDLTVRGGAAAIGPYKIDYDCWDWSEVDSNIFVAPDTEAADISAVYVYGLCEAGSPVGAIVEIVSENVPAGLEAPIYAKLDQDIALAALTGKKNTYGMRVGSDGKLFFFV